MRINITRSDRATLLELARLPDGERAQFFEALNRQEPRLDPDNLIRGVVESSGIARDRVERYLAVLGTMRASCETSGVGISEFLGELKQNLQHPPDSKSPTLGLLPTDSQLDSLLRDAGHAVDIKSPFGRAVKGTTLLTDAERAYHHAKVLTDLRSIFEDAPTKSPISAIVLHTLRIAYGGGGEEDKGEFFVEMDLRDLEDLKSAVERAILKEKQIRTFFGDKIEILRL